MKKTLLQSFSKSRAEEYPDDLWGEFVVPPRYADYSCLFNYTRAIMIEGGRGSGKTMFLKYHCHKTRFSPKRSQISASELEHVGLYFRPDTDFCSMINEFNFEHEWKKVFTHYIAINLLGEFASSIHSIVNTHIMGVNFESDLMSMKTPSSLADNIDGFPEFYRGLKEYAGNLRAGFNLWVNDPESFDRPKFIEPRTVLLELIQHLTQNTNSFNDLCFYIYFDEFENLARSQQIVVNSWIKHGKAPLIFNCAYKRGAKVSRETLSDESLVLRNDYRVVDIESFDQLEFKVFAAEVLCLKLSESTNIENGRAIKEYFCNEEFNEQRNLEQHQKLVLEIARAFFPSMSYGGIAKDIIGTEILRRRLEQYLIAPALGKESTYSSAEFVDENFPEESLINGLLLNRASYTPEKVLSLFKALVSGDKTNYKSLVEQNLVGAILWIYLSASWKQCPVYAGFESFCFLARGNMRHFLELCHQTISVSSRNKYDVALQEAPSVSIDIQSEGAMNSSRLELEKIDELGKHGEKLRFIVNRLGLFFQLLHKRKSQSETEVNHFSIKISDNNLLDATTKILLEEAVVWSILIEREGDTKRKGTTDFSSTEYMLHPIYAPHFGISYRRKKKFEFTPEQLKVIFSSSEKDYKKLCNDFSTKWDLGRGQVVQPQEVLKLSSEQKGLWD